MEGVEGETGKERGRKEEDGEKKGGRGGRIWISEVVA